jgi:hypothetical protein
MNVSTAASPIASTDEIAAIRDVVITAYCNGAYNALDTASMAEGFHPEFAILGAAADGLDRYTIGEWIAAIEKRKSAPGFDIATAQRDCELLSIDVAGDAANVKMEVRRDGALMYTDYLFLLRFADGWKIVSKIYHAHG